LSVSHCPLFKIMPSDTVIPGFTCLIRSFKAARKEITRKTKINSHYFPTGTTIGLQEEWFHTSENWLVNWKTGINLCISYKRKLTYVLIARIPRVFTTVLGTLWILTYVWVENKNILWNWECYTVSYDFICVYFYGIKQNVAVADLTTPSQHTPEANLRASVKKRSR
jgi:hypothetical protein